MNTLIMQEGIFKYSKRKKKLRVKSLRFIKIKLMIISGSFGEEKEDLKSLSAKFLNGITSFQILMKLKNK